MTKSDYRDLNLPKNRKEVVLLYNNKMTPEKIAKLAGGATRQDIERILDE